MNPKDKVLSRIKPTMKEQAKSLTWYRCRRCFSVFTADMAKWREGDEKTCPYCGYSDIKESKPCGAIVGVEEES